jgi:hypothetical protein
LTGKERSSGADHDQQQGDCHGYIKPLSAKDVTAAIRALTNWSEAEASDNARDLHAGVTRYTAVHAAIMPLYHAEEQASRDAGNKSYKLETFLGFCRHRYQGQGMDSPLHSAADPGHPGVRRLTMSRTIATFALWVKEDARARKAATGSRREGEGRELGELPALLEGPRPSP